MTQEIQKKKILLITRPIAPPWDEASKNFAYYLAKSLDMFEMYLLTNGLIKDMPAHIHQKPIYTSNHLSYLQKARLLKLRKILRTNFDILHYMLTPNKLNSFSFKAFLKNNKAKTIQTIATLREDLFSDEDFRKILFADLIITYSDYAKNKLNSLGFNNVKRVYPGIDLRKYSPEDKDKKVLKNLGLEEDDFIVTFPGEYVRLGATDDIVNMIIENTKILREKKIKIIFACRLKNDRLAIEKNKEVINKLKEKNIQDLVVFIDIFPDMEKLYNLSDVIIFPVQNMRGKFDIPLAVIEPMACEKPVILSNLPILSELGNNNNSVIIEKGNTKQLIESILDLYNNPEKRKTIGAEARRFVEKNFDLKNVSEIYQKIYEIL